MPECDCSNLQLTLQELITLPALDLGCQAFDGDVGSGVFGQNFSEFRSQTLFAHACEELVRQCIQESITLTCVRRRWRFDH